MRAEREDPRIHQLSKSIAEALADGLSGRRRSASGGIRPATILSASGGALLTAALVIAPNHRALAQDELLEEITVTGSRIPRRDFTANAPVTTVDEAIFDETGSIGVETILNQLPQFTPAVTQFATYDVENTARNTVGASTISLRGLGPNRNVVLIDGRRAMPVNPTMVIDTNSIPAAAIERVEIISGGASAVYGADAVGGVNFILKDDFEGATSRHPLRRHAARRQRGDHDLGLIGVSPNGDGNVMSASSRQAGKNSSSGNATGASKAANPPPAHQVFPTETWFDNGPGCCRRTPSISKSSTRSSARRRRTRFRHDSFYINRTLDGTGTVFTGLNIGAQGVRARIDTQARFTSTTTPVRRSPFRVIQPDGGIKENTWYQAASIPLDRLSSFASGISTHSRRTHGDRPGDVPRTETRTRLGATADTIGVWGRNGAVRNELYGGRRHELGADGLPNTGDAGENMATLLTGPAGNIS
jgi:outer membrane receptor protein involved in Fe transport